MSVGKTEFALVSPFQHIQSGSQELYLSNRSCVPILPIWISQWLPLYFLLAFSDFRFGSNNLFLHFSRSHLNLHSKPCHPGHLGDLARVLRPRHVIEKQLDLLALLPAHINPPTRPLPFHGELPAIDHLVGQLPSAMFWQSSTFRTWQIYRLASSLLPTMSTFSTLNAGLT